MQRLGLLAMTVAPDTRSVALSQILNAAQRRREAEETLQRLTGLGSAYGISPPQAEQQKTGWLARLTAPPPWQQASAIERQAAGMLGRVMGAMEEEEAKQKGLRDLFRAADIVSRIGSRSEQAKQGREKISDLREYRRRLLSLREKVTSAQTKAFKALAKNREVVANRRNLEEVLSLVSQVRTLGREADLALERENPDLARRNLELTDPLIDQLNERLGTNLPKLRIEEGGYFKGPKIKAAPQGALPALPSTPEPPVAATQPPETPKELLDPWLWEEVERE